VKNKFQTIWIHKFEMILEHIFKLFLKPKIHFISNKFKNYFSTQICELIFKWDF